MDEKPKGDVMGWIEKIGAGIVVFGALFAGISKFNSLENRVTNLEKRPVAAAGMSAAEQYCLSIVTQLADAHRDGDTSAALGLEERANKFKCAEGNKPTPSVTEPSM